MGALVFDASPLSYFARAGLLDELARLTAAHRRCVTRAVLEEIRAGVCEHPALEPLLAAAWIDAVDVVTLRGVQVFAEYIRRLGSDRPNVGEAATLAWAEVHGAVAVVDDKVARKIAKSRGVQLKGSIGIICNAVVDHVISVDVGRAHLMSLRAAGAWLAWQAEDYNAWAEQRGLL